MELHEEFGERQCSPKAAILQSQPRLRSFFLYHSLSLSHTLSISLVTPLFLSFSPSLPFSHIFIHSQFSLIRIDDSEYHLRLQINKHRLQLIKITKVTSLSTRTNLSSFFWQLRDSELWLAHPLFVSSMQKEQWQRRRVGKDQGACSLARERDGKVKSLEKKG